MKLVVFRVLLISTCFWFCRAQAQPAPLGSAITYQGVLNSAGTGATGNYDFRFALFDAPSNGNQIGPTLTNLNVAVNAGLFDTTLDFGISSYAGNATWLAIAVRPAGTSGQFTSLLPVQPLNAVPYALFAANLGQTNGFATTAQLNTTVAAATNALGTMAYQPTNGPSMINAIIGAASLSVAPSPGTRAGLNWNGGSLTSPQDPVFNLFGNTDHGGDGDGVEWQWSFNQLYFGPVNGGHVQFGLASDNQGDAFIAQWYNNGGVPTNPNASHAIGWHLKAGLPGGPIAQGDLFWHSWASTYDLSNYYSVWHLSGWNGDPNQDWHTTGPDFLTVDSDHGLEVPGYIRVGYVNSSAPGASLAVDYTNKATQEYDLFQTTTFYETNLNLLGHWTNGVMLSKDLFLYAPWGPVSVSFPTNWMWENEAGNAVAPTTVRGSNFLHVELKVLVGSRTNYVAHALTGSSIPAIDPLAAAYFAAANITGTQEMQAYNNLARNLRGHGFATTNKLIALYAFSGVSAASDALDFMGNHNGTFHGTVTHSITNGVTGDGSTGYMDTGIVPTNVFASRDTGCIFVWNRSSAFSANPATFMGAVDTYPVGQTVWMNLGGSGGNFRFDGPSDFIQQLFPATGGFSGFVAENRLAPAIVDFYFDGMVDASTDASTSLGYNQSLYVLARNDEGSADFFTDANLAVAGVAQNMSAVDIINLRADIAQWVSDMGR